MRSDSDLVQSVLTGNLYSFDVIVERYKDLVFSVALNVVGNYHVAEDIAQETFIDCYLGLANLKDTEKLYAWLYGIAKRKSLHFVSRNRIHMDIEDYSEDLSMVEWSPEQMFIQKESSDAVKAAVVHLSEKNRQVIELFYFQEMSVNSIAEKLGLTVGTVKSRLYEARNKLKGELDYMNTNKTMVSENFTEKVAQAIQKLRYYYVLNGGLDGYDKVIEETETIAEGIFDKDEKSKLLSEILLYRTWYEDNRELKEEALVAAELANNANVVSNLLIDQLLEMGDDYEAGLRFIEEQAVPKMEAMNSEHGKGCVLFWKSRNYLMLKNYDKAYVTMKEAESLIDKSDNYHACALSAIRSMEFLLKNAENILDGFHATSETLLHENGKLLFASQPGFSCCSNILYQKMKYGNQNYYRCRVNSILFDTLMKAGEQLKSKDGNYIFKVMSYKENVVVKAGAFENCMHVRLTAQGEYSVDAYYAPNIGLVKSTFFDGDEESYELCDYVIKGGSGYMPFAEGNRWTYDNLKLPDYVCRKFEYEIDWTDGKAAHFIVLDLATMKKNYLTECQLDSDIYIAQADNCCTDWEIDVALENLQKAVRTNSTQESVLTALGGIDYLKRFKEACEKGYRICPSSYNTSYLRVNEKNKRCYFDEAIYAFGPYRYGTRFEENRIFGMKIFRYLQDTVGCLFDYKRWSDGYTKTYPYPNNNEFTISIAVENVGTVATKLGTYENCLKVTVEVERAGEKKNYYFDAPFQYVHCGKKEFYFAKGYGIVKCDFTWGNMLTSSAELVAYELPAANENSYFPVQIGNQWEYDEVTLTKENYRAKRKMKVAGGIGEKYILTESQEFWYLGTEEEYEKFKVNNR